MISLLLYPLSLIYRLGNYLHRRYASARSRRVALPVISVGGISAGGSGKTPVVRELVRELQDEYYLVVLSRGYGRIGKEDMVWEGGESPLLSPDMIGDEPALLARSLRNGLIAVGNDRGRLLERLITERSFPPKTLVLLDDGFQHYRLQRDLDIVVVDEKTAAERFTLPAGYLREPWTALRRADVLLVSGERGVRKGERYGREHLLTGEVAYRSGTIRHWSSGREYAERNRPVLLVTGIARPERVANSLREQGVNIASRQRFRDHHRYSRKDVARLIEQAQAEGIEAIVTTEKDAVKLEAFPELDELLYVLPLWTELEFGNRDELSSLVERIHREKQNL